MKIEDFLGLVRVLANQRWVRYYLHMSPGKMVLEIADPRTADVERLDAEFAAKGFGPRLELDFNGWTLHRWTITRSDVGDNE